MYEELIHLGQTYCFPDPVVNSIYSECPDIFSAIHKCLYTELPSNRHSPYNGTGNIATVYVNKK